MDSLDCSRLFHLISLILPFPILLHFTSRVPSAKDRLGKIIAYMVEAYWYKQMHVACYCVIKHSLGEKAGCLLLSEWLRLAKACQGMVMYRRPRSVLQEWHAFLKQIEILNQSFLNKMIHHQTLIWFLSFWADSTFRSFWCTQTDLGVLLLLTKSIKP